MKHMHPYTEVSDPLHLPSPSPLSFHLPDSRTQHQSTFHCPASYDTNQSVSLAWGSSVPLGGSGRYSHLPHWVDTPKYELSDSCTNNTYTSHKIRLNSSSISPPPLPFSLPFSPLPPSHPLFLQNSRYPIRISW